MSEVDEEAIRKQMEELQERRNAAQAKASAPAAFQMNDRSSVRHVIGVSSGKGGVGKSLVTGMLAAELNRSGARVGILDADITGPSIPKMFGLAGTHAMAVEGLLLPLESKQGIRIMSANFVLENDTDPVVWRGPVLSNALQQFFEDVLWGELDYLLVDMPPGTSDVALTVFQSLNVEGLIVVSSPQDLVQMVVGKAVNMADMMRIPILGIVENMAYAICPDCGKKLELFGPSRLTETAELYQVDALDQLPIDASFARMVDEGSFEDELPAGLVPRAIKAITNTAAFHDAS